MHKPGNRLTRKLNLFGWTFVIPAALLIFVLSFYPMIQAFILSFQSGMGNNLKFSGISNYTRLFSDPLLKTAVGNTLFYLIVQVPIMILLALIFASLLNDKNLRFKGFFRTAIFLPCVTALVSYAIIFKSLFAPDGLINTMLLGANMIASPVPFLTDPAWGKAIIIISLTWRWTGYNMVFYLAGLQNIDPFLYEAARIDGASSFQQFRTITVPLLRPIILLTTIMSTNGTLQLFDEVRTLTGGGPGNATITISQYIYKLLFDFAPQFGYAATVSFIILFLVAALSFVQLQVGDKR